MRKQILCIIIIFSLFIFNNSLILYESIHIFNHTAVKNNIDFMSSDLFKGRLAGTPENLATAAYIKDQFKAAGLQPLNGKYYETFKTDYPEKIDDKPYLKILDKKGMIVKEYSYGTDYKEDMLNFKANKLSFTKNDETKVNNDILQVIKGSDSFIFYVPYSNDLSFRSSFITSANHSMYIMVNKDILGDIKNYLTKNYTISCYIPFHIKATELNNVIGYVKGRNPEAPPVVLTAHFDHLGSDLNGNVYSGALDNASGIAFVIEMSKYLSSLGQPERNILFIGFNAEEFGCLGSKNFVDSHKDSLKGSKVFNFDMIGTNNTGVPLCIMGGKKDTANSELIRSIAATCNSEHVYFNYIFEDSSDHEYFRKNNIDAVTFNDNDTSRIHTPQDKAAFISTLSIDRCFNVASKQVIKYAFNGNPMLIYYKQGLAFAFISTFVFSIIFIKFNRNDI